MPWGDKPEVMKGSLGERIVDRFLIEKGLVPYAPNVDCAHPFDRICSTRDKSRLFIAEVKTKARRTHYPDTGIDIRHFNEYQHIQQRHSLSVWVFFVDEYLQKIYGNSLPVLSKQLIVWHRGRELVYPMRHGRIIYFPLETMKDVAPLTDEYAAELKELSRRSYEYVCDQDYGGNAA